MYGRVHGALGSGVNVSSNSAQRTRGGSNRRVVGNTTRGVHGSSAVYRGCRMECDADLARVRWRWERSQGRAVLARTGTGWCICSDVGRGSRRCSSARAGRCRDGWSLQRVGERMFHCVYYFSAVHWSDSVPSLVREEKAHGGIRVRRRGGRTTLSNMRRGVRPL
jgi:hypothetical protein